MKFIKSSDEEYKTRKKVISTRVTEILVKALEGAKTEMPSRFNLAFSIPGIIDIALEDALEEIKTGTEGYDFLELEKFRYHIKHTIERCGVAETTSIDPDHEWYSILNAYTELKYGDECHDNLIMSDLIKERRVQIDHELADEAGW